MSEHTLHISIGPVQGFVAQARRTRDLWAGSFLLSWMSGQLMAAVLRRDGSIVFPAVGTEDAPTDPMLSAILGKPLSDDRHPKIGSLPNRFKAQVPANFKPESAVEEAKQKWQNLAETIWEGFVESAVNKNEKLNEDQKSRIRAIWERQIKEFWEIQWVKGEHPADNGDDAKWLDSRKNWRTHWPPKEGGDHCTTMGSWQELSGFVRSRQREKQDKFWNALRKNVGRLDLQDDERLCAIALVKRLFPKLESEQLKTAIGWSFQTKQTKSWPSTAYMAVAPWLMHIAKNREFRQKLNGYVETIGQAVESVDKKAFKQLSREYSTRLRLPDLEPLGRNADLDGNLFLETALVNPRATPLTNDPPKTDEDDPDKETRDKLSQSLKKLGKEVGGDAKPYYALLLMDGDRLGKLLRTLGEQEVSQALDQFVKRVSKIVECNNGVTIYAGGDDVLAMLPATQAIQCARQLRKAYDEAFYNLVDANNKHEIPTTASCAIVFTHYHNPLRDVMKLARKELDEVAKEQNGRNSLALAVMQPGGVHNRWVSQFSGAIIQPESLEKLREKIIENKDLYSTGFFYNLRERYGSWFSECDEKDRYPIALAEYYKGNPPKDKDERTKAEKAIETFLAACQTQRGKEKETKEENPFQIEGAFIARFLAELNRFDSPKKEENS